MKEHTAVSLFSSAGIGELGIKNNGISILLANELLRNRCKLYRVNHPETHLIEGDIWAMKEEAISYVKEFCPSKEVFLVYATPPCQGMSTNGFGKLQAEIEAGNRPKEDFRNRLVIPAMDIICSLKPQWVLFENVPGMKNTIIRTNDGPANILDYISKRLGPDYCGKGEVITCSDYGIPQIRKRLITIFTRTEKGRQYFNSNRGTFFPPYEKSAPISLFDAIGNFPPLEAVGGKESCLDFHPMHYTSIIKPEKLWWISNTPEGDTAYNNQCVNPECLFKENQRYIDQQQNGRWQSNKNTPIYCKKCGELLPRPTMIDSVTKKRRLIRGFHSAYRRMKWNEPARALTSNMFFEASDNKIHPDQNRVLSAYEVLVIQTIADYEYTWEINGCKINQSLFSEVIGESVPPKLIEFITKKFVDITDGSLLGREPTLF